MFKVVITTKSKTETYLFYDFFSAFASFKQAKGFPDFVEGHIYFLEEMLV